MCNKTALHKLLRLGWSRYGAVARCVERDIPKSIVGLSIIRFANVKL